MRAKKGISLVELLIVVTILALLIVIIASGLNPIGLMNKARDSQRKKDLSRIKVAFEEYYNDRACYPSQSYIDGTLMNRNFCRSSIFTWLKPWPCDPNGNPYMIVVGDDVDCPKWYKVLTNLENKNDKDIPENWGTELIHLGGDFTVSMANYGVSSGNISWMEEKMDARCINLGSCYYLVDGVCNSMGNGCIGPNCYLGECRSACQVTCCGVGCD